MSFRSLPQRSGFTQLASARAALLCLALLEAGTACGLHPHTNTDPARASGDEIVIGAEEIARLGLQTAWDVIKQKVPQLGFRENSAGEPTRAWRRGRSSVLLDDSPLLFVDGTRMSDLKALEQIPAHTVESIRILSGLQGTTYYGTNAAGGVILGQTKS